MTPLSRFASSPLGGRTRWPGKASSMEVMSPLSRFASSPLGGRTRWPGKASSMGARARIHIHGAHS